MTSSYWGYHLIVDAGKCDETLIRDITHIREFNDVLIERIDMKKIGDPRIEYTAGEFPDKAGYTLSQIIVTSNIMAHFVDQGGQLYLDVFSCKPFSEDTVIDTVREYFEPQSINKYFLVRDALKPNGNGVSETSFGAGLYSA